ncbi:MAG: hypothetical protein V2A70_08960 [Candidatus Omnitrophota bacterium]
MLDLLVGDKDWSLVYFDHDGLIFLRNVPENEPLIRQYAIDFNTWVPAVSDMRRMGSAQSFPYREINRATMLKDMGYLDQSLSQADAALAVLPGCLEAFKIKARIYGQRHAYQNAFENYRWALLQEPDDMKLRRGLALAYVGLGEYDYALKQAERLDDIAGDPGAPYVRAKVFAKKKQYQNAYDILDKQIFPLERGIREILAVGDVFAEDKVYDWAVKAYWLAVRKDMTNKEALEKLKSTEKLYRGMKIKE